MSSSSQARHGEINNRARKRECISGMKGDTWKGAGGMEFFMKGGGSRPGV